MNKEHSFHIVSTALQSDAANPSDIVRDGASGCGERPL